MHILIEHADKFWLGFSHQHHEAVKQAEGVCCGAVDCSNDGDTAACQACTTVMTSLAVKLSNPLVGSSKNSTRGEVIRAMPMLVRLA